MVHDAVDHERVRVARDLHDGLLQSFTGVVLQLETVHSLLESRPDEARQMITDTQATMMADQRELRRFVEQLRPRAARREATFDFAGRLEDLRSRFDKQWGVKLAFDVEQVDPTISGFIGQETFRLIHEAVTNSAKHGAASFVRVEVRTAGSEMHIQVADNGTGFAFRGRLTLEEMKEQGTGPMILAERVQSLNGSLVVDSTEGGATVTMSVPLGWGAA
jgi:signal transduction histidine kinase